MSEHSVGNYKELDVWQKALALTTLIYELTARFPVTERYGLISQIRRATTSIPANIAEGWGRGSTSEYIQFLTISRGSLLELETHLLVAQNLHLLEPKEFDVPLRSVDDIGRMLNRLIAALKAKRARSKVSGLGVRDSG